MALMSLLTNVSAIIEASVPPFALHHLDALLTILSVFGELVVIILLGYRGIWRTLPLFGGYVIWAMVSDLGGLNFLIAPNQSGYSRFYIVETTVDSLLMFCVLVELAWSILRPVRSSLPRATVFVLGLLVGLVGLVIWPFAGMTLPPEQGPSGILLFQLQETFAILRVVCFLVMASLSQVLSVGWRDRELQVATGLGVYSIVSLLVSVLHSHQAVGPYYHWIDLTVSVSYLGTLSYWVLSFSKKEHERKDFSPQMRQLLLSMSGGARVSRTALKDIPSESSRKKDK